MLPISQAMRLRLWEAKVQFHIASKQRWDLNPGLTSSQAHALAGSIRVALEDARPS